MNKNIKLIHQFSIIAILATVLFGYAFGLLLGRSMEQKIINSSLNEAADIIVQSVIKHFDPAELSVPKIGREHAGFSHEMGHLSLGPNVEKVKIWNRDMRVVWDRDSSVVNKSAEDREEVRKLEQAFRGERVMYAGNREEGPEGHYSGIKARRVIESYVPIQYRKGEGIVAVLETYINSDPFYAVIQRYKKLIWLWTFSGCSILYLLLFGIVWKASRRMDEQMHELSAAIVSLERERSDGKQLQYKLEKAATEWKMTFDSTQDIILMLDHEFRVMRTNAASVIFFGKPYHRMIGEDVGQMLAQVGLAPGPGFFAQNTRAIQHHEYEGYFGNKGVWMAISLDPIIDQEDALTGYVLVMRDISEIRKAHEEKERIQTQFLQAQKMDSIGRLAGGIAHDFNNIISVITGFSELSLKELPDNSPIKENLIAIHSSGEKAAALTRQLLAFSRKQVLQIDVVDANATVRDSVSMLRRLIGEDIVLSLHTDQCVRKVMADPNQLEQILMNLVVNARDAMPDGGNLIIDTVDEDISEGQENTEGITAGQYVRISVQDTGGGMSEEVQKRIFEPFFSTKAVGKGTGLGLATVYGIVRQHRGYITVNSALGKGTTFHIYLPASDREGDLKAPDAPDKILNGSETVLVVDDEPLLIKLILNMLKPLGYNVLHAQGGEEALLISERYDGRIDLLLTDVIMPGMNGKELAERLLRKRPGTKVIFMSGYTDETIAHHGVLEKGVVLINKPLEESHLAAQIREVIDRKDQDTPAPQVTSGKQMNILLADDNADMRNLIRIFLKDYARTVHTARNGREAVQKFRENSYDLVLMDMQMPVMDGLEAIREIRKSEGESMKTPIIAFTGNGKPDDIARCLKAGASVHLAKPVRKDQLIKTVLFFEKKEPSTKREDLAGEPRKVVAQVDPGLRDLVPEYLEDRKEDIKKIREAMHDGDYETVRILGHTLKGSGGGYGFNPITEIGLHIEEAAKRECPEEINQWTGELAEYIDNVDIRYE